MSDGPGGDWALERPTGAVEELHAPVGPISGRVVIVNEVEAPTLVLGSSQAGVEVAPVSTWSDGVPVAGRCC